MWNQSPDGQEMPWTLIVFKVIGFGCRIACKQAPGESRKKNSSPCSCVGVCANWYMYEAIFYVMFQYVTTYIRQGFH